uniref:Transposon Ty3-G Gag-Pol polyprotein n=1 Tax=Cajanus cajan TaxID=3821 RepID=A0A151T8R8_CAJCA|nr:Transposon Ty3-G Gag-Pol polyprotein [Cajanus cajan]
MINENIRCQLINLQREYLDAFAWSYHDMPGLDLEIVEYRLPMREGFCLVKQKLQRIKHEWSLKIKEEVQKQLDVGFLIVSRYLEWLANTVLILKKNGKFQVCIDYRDLNKASPKDDFPLPHIDMLKNVGATNQRAMVTLFHDMIHKEGEVYVDDMIAKSKNKHDHLIHLRKLFNHLCKYQLKLNPAKCTFRVRSGKLLGFIVNEKGIEIDVDKVKAITEMPLPKTKKEVRGFLGRVNYITRLISLLTDTYTPIFKLL